MDVYIPILLSTLIILLFMGFLLCVLTTVAPVFINQGNANDLFPLVRKATKVNIAILVIAVVLVILTQGTTIANRSMTEVTVGFALWSVVPYFLLNAREKKLKNQTGN